MSDTDRERVLQTLREQLSVLHHSTGYGFASSAEAQQLAKEIARLEAH